MIIHKINNMIKEQVLTFPPACCYCSNFGFNNNDIENLDSTVLFEPNTIPIHLLSFINNRIHLPFGNFDGTLNISIYTDTKSKAIQILQDYITSIEFKICCDTVNAFYPVLIETDILVGKIHISYTSPKYIYLNNILPSDIVLLIERMLAIEFVFKIRTICTLKPTALNVPDPVIVFNMQPHKTLFMLEELDLVKLSYSPSKNKDLLVPYNECLLHDNEKNTWHPWDVGGIMPCYECLVVPCIQQSPIVTVYVTKKYEKVKLLLNRPIIAIILICANQLESIMLEFTNFPDDLVITENLINKIDTIVSGENTIYILNIRSPPCEVHHNNLYNFSLIDYIHLVLIFKELNQPAPLLYTAYNTNYTTMYGIPRYMN